MDIFETSILDVLDATDDSSISDSDATGSSVDEVESSVGSSVDERETSVRGSDSSFTEMESSVGVEVPAKERKCDSKEIENLNTIPRTLKTWNKVAAVIQFAQSIPLIYFSFVADTNWYLYTNYPGNFDDPSEAAADGTDFGRPVPVEIAAYSLAWYSAAFILLAGLYHHVVAHPWVRSTYEYYIARNQNPFRWAECSVSTSLMRIMVAQLSGITDVQTLVALFVLTSVTMILWAMHENINAKARADSDKQNWFPFYAAWLPNLASWAIIFSYYATAVINTNPPNIVRAIVFVIFTLDLSFAILFWMQWAKIGPFQDYVKGEIAFIVLSFTSKTLLAWLNYGSDSSD